MFHVIGVHGPDLLSSRSSEYFDDFDKLINARLSWKKWLSKHKLCHDAAGGPDVYRITFSMLNYYLVRSNLPILVV